MEKVGSIDHMQFIRKYEMINADPNVRRNEGEVHFKMNKMSQNVFYESKGS